MWKIRACTYLARINLRGAKYQPEISLKRNVSISSTVFQQEEVFAKKNGRQRSVRGEKDIGPMGWFLLLVPITTFGLGTWQVKRRKWKQDLVANLKARTSSEPQELPHDLSELEALEYHPVRVRGHFDHSRELYLGPRSLIVDGDAASEGSVLSKSAGGQHGYCVVTPFHLADKDLCILVNRGWVPTKFRNPASRREGQVEGEVELIGVVRLDEQRAPFTPRNQPEAWFYRDLPRMAEVAGTAAVFLDAKVESSVDGGPIGGQTRISLRNEHLSYILTWYGLSAVTGFMWFRHFIHGLPGI